MESRFRLRISRMFRSSFGSCRNRNLSDVVEKAVAVPKKETRPEPEPEPEARSLLLSPKARPFPSMCRPRCPDAPETLVFSSCIAARTDSLPRRKVSHKYSPFALGVMDGSACPPASPVSPLNLFRELRENKEQPPKKKKKKKKKKTTMTMTTTAKAKAKTKAKAGKNRELLPFSSSSQDTNFGGWFSSEDETDTLFSSKSISSDSSEPRRRRHRNRRRRSETASVLPLDGTVKGSFAVVKRSSDPYNDFRKSMVEMIVEKQIFAAKDLEQLLQCFLSLNSHHHHRIIIQVFMEIWEALFCNWS